MSDPGLEDEPGARPEGATRPRNRALGIAAVAMAAAAWGLGTVLSKGAIDDDLSPSVLLAIQLVAASAALGLATALTGRLPRWDRELVALSWPGVIEPGVSSQLYLVGLVTTAASTATIIFTSEPAIVVALAWLLLGERLTWKLASLCAVTLAGVLLVVLPGADSGTNTLGGAALVIAGTIGASLHSIISSRQVSGTATSTRLTDLDPLPLTWLHTLVGLAVGALVIVVRTVAGDTLVVPASAGRWAIAALSGLIMYGLPFWLYLSALRHLRVSVAAQFLALIPVFGVALSWLILDERLDPLQLVGGLIVLAALIGVSRLEEDEHLLAVVPPWGEAGAIDQTPDV